MSVRVTNLSKQFAAGDVPAVKDVSFVAPTGGITTLLGPSGSGKTTVLRMIAGLEEPDAGSVMIGDRECTNVPVRSRGVGFVFQGYALFEHLNVRGNIAFGLSIQKLSRAEIDQRVHELLGLVQLEGLGDRMPSQLSGGQQQRVAFARALATKPAVLLLDEPFAALDTRVRIELRDWLRALNEKTHLTTIFVTHDQDEALELSQQVVVMKGGKLEQAGTPDQVYDHPASAFVASFIGSSNVLRGSVQNGKAAVGPLSRSAPVGTADGHEVHAFVRPHEVKLRAANTVDADLSHGVIEQLSRVGGTVRAKLKLPSGERILVQLPADELRTLAVGVGDRVVVDFGGARMFVGDYSI
ncbi:MAG: sulfate/molybdate ABC transporter ATP-binding protein [Myxococcaceae bacterium]